MKKLWRWIYNYVEELWYTHKRKKLLKELRKRDPFIY
jgi:hypothetical protein